MENSLGHGFPCRTLSCPGTDLFLMAEYECAVGKWRIWIYTFFLARHAQVCSLDGFTQRAQRAVEHSTVTI
jgi:hypothetical protein